MNRNECGERRFVEVDEVLSLVEEFINRTTVELKKLVAAVADRSVEIPSRADISSGIDISYDNSRDCSIPEVKPKTVTSSKSRKRNPDAPKTTKTKNDTTGATQQKRKPSNKSNSTEQQKPLPTAKVTTRATSKQKIAEKDAANPSPSTKISKTKERDGNDPKANSTKSKLSRNTKNDREIGEYEKRLLNQEERRVERRTIRRERRLARAFDEFSRIVANHAGENGYLPVVKQEQDGPTLSQSKTISFDLDSSCSCSDTSCSCWMYTTDSESSTDSSGSNVAVVGRRR